MEISTEQFQKYLKSRGITPISLVYDATRCGWVALTRSEVDMNHWSRVEESDSALRVVLLDEDLERVSVTGGFFGDLPNMKPWRELPDGIRHYLLDWKDRNRDRWMDIEGWEVGLNRMDTKQLKDVFHIAVLDDLKNNFE